MGPLFHGLRDIRAGKPHTRMTSRESAWSLANHLGYLSACETHGSDSLERSTQNQLTFLKRVAAAWESQDRYALFRLTHECDAFFDPNRPSTLVYFTGLGGIDLFVRLLCDNAEWLTGTHTNANFAFPIHLAGDGVFVYNTMLRVLTELLVCHNDVGWYIYDRHRGLIFRLVEMIRVERLRDSAIMLLEHIISVVGPVLHIPSHPLLVTTIRGLSDGGLASMCRVLALLVVPGVMTDQIWKSKRLEPFPQCLIRIEKIQTIVDDNVEWIIQEPGLVLRLLELGKVESRGVRIFQGNRTMTVLSPQVVVPTTTNTAAAAAAAPSSQAANNATANVVVAAPAAAPPNVPSAPFSPQSGGSTAGASVVGFGVTEDYGEEIAEEEEDEEEEGDEPFDITEETMTNPMLLQQALLQLLHSVSSQPPAGTAPSEMPPPPPPPPPPAAPSGGPPAATPAPTAEALQVLAESISQEMLPVNGLDSINFSWFCGRPDTKGRWRFQAMRVHPRENEPTVGMLQSSHEHTAQSNQFIESMVKYEAHQRSKMSPKRKLEVASTEQQAIVNSQSEIFFVLNSIMVTRHYSRAWRLLAEHGTLQRCLDAFDYVFFVHHQSTSIHATPPNQRHNHASLHMPSNLSDRFEAPAAVAARVGRFYETFWNPAPSTCIVTPSTLATEQTNSPGSAHDEDFVANLHDDPAATARECESDDESEDNADHRHDPDTLRKLELLRIIHEFCNAQDREELSQLMSEPGRTLADGSVTSSLEHVMHTLAEKIAAQLTNGNEDACTETVGAHALESILRCLGFHSASRRRSSEKSGSTLLRTHELVGHRLLPHLIGERIFNAVNANSGTAHALAPWKRVDAFFAVIGEICKYNSFTLHLLVEYLRGDVTVPNVPTFLGVPASQPDAATAASQLAAAPIARGQNDTVLSVFQYRLQRFGVDTNLFIRCLCLSITPFLSSPVNYVWKPLQQDALFGGDCPSPQDIAASLRDSRQYLPGERVLEPSKFQMRRIYYVREQSRLLVEDFAATIMPLLAIDAASSAELSEGTSAALDARRMQWSRDALATIAKAPSFFDETPCGRPFAELFTEAELCILHPQCPLPRAGLAVALRQHLLATAGDPNATPINAEQEDDLKYISQNLFRAPHELAYSMLSTLNAETIENTERLCVVTSTILLFLRESHFGGQAAVDRLLNDLATVAAGRREKYVARRKRQNSRTVATPPAVCPHQFHRNNGNEEECSIETPLEQQCDNFVLFGYCVPNTVVRDYYESHGTDFFKNFFRLLCVWLGHYSCSQRYVETLYYCTEVPFGEWKMLSLYLLRVIPNYFSA